MKSLLGMAAPGFQDIRGWVNSEALDLTILRGKVVFLDFWTYSCSNCVPTLPYVRELHESYAHYGLEQTVIQVIWTDRPNYTRSTQPSLEVGGGLPIGVTELYIVLGALLALKSYESMLELRG
jgi:thiol-disulfide isomerase/thioredoxin